MHVFQGTQAFRQSVNFLTSTDEPRLKDWGVELMSAADPRQYGRPSPSLGVPRLAVEIVPTTRTASPPSRVESGPPPPAAPHPPRINRE